MKHTLLPALAALAGLLCSLPLHAQETAIYRCTDSTGQMTVQNAPCPAGTREDKRMVRGVASMPIQSAPAAPASATPGTRPAPAPGATNGLQTPDPAATVPSQPAPAPRLPLPATTGPTGPASTIYRCSDRSGHVTISNLPCPAGSHEEKQQVQEVATMPMSPLPAPAAPPAQPGSTLPAAGVSAPATAPPAATPGKPALPTFVTETSPPGGIDPQTASSQDDGARLPPPNLFQCTTYDKGSYLTENGEPPSRCLPLRTVGLDGNPNAGAGQACEVVYDVCSRVPDQGLCDAWRKRLGETEVAARFGRPENAAANQAEYARVKSILAGTTCAARP